MSYLQLVAGYVLTGLTVEQCFFVVIGPGANGKTVFLRTLQTLLGEGEYALTTPPETLLAKRDTGGPSPDLARLRGARLVVASEPNEGCILEEALVKRLTGQDKIVCRDPYCGLFEYVPTFKLFLATNTKPIIHGTDHAIWRRIHLIPFMAAAS
jgi:putative DNA primase/helicase